MPHPFSPGRGRVLLVPVDYEMKRTKAGIVLPDQANMGRLSAGRVVEIGQGKMTESGEIRPPWVDCGWTVLHTSHGAHTLYGPDGTKYLILDEDEVECVINAEAL